MSTLTRLWQGRGRTDRVLLVGGALGLVLGFGVPAVARRLDPTSAVSTLARDPGPPTQLTVEPRSDLRYRYDQALDPWGRPLLGVRPYLGSAGASPLGAAGSGLPFHAGIPFHGDEVRYSVGPDGIDQDRRGDDLVAARQVPALRLGALAGIGFLLLWLVLGPYADDPRHPQLRVELARAGVLSIGFLLWARSGIGLVVGLPEDPSVFMAAVRSVGPSLVHPWVAVTGTYVVACYVAALAWRLTRPPLAEPDPPPVADPGQLQ